MTAPVFQTAASATGSGTSLVITKPTGTVEGDLLVACVKGTQSGGFTVAPPAGWTTIEDGQALLTSAAVFWKKATDAEGADYTFTLSVGAANSSGAIVRIDGQHATSPIAAAPAYASGSSSVADPPASGAVASGDYLGVVIIGHSGADHVPPSGYTERVDISGVEIATLALTAITSEDPGTTESESSWRAFTLLIAAGTGTLQAVSPTDDITTTGWTDTPLWSKVDDDPASPDGTLISATSS